MCALVCVELHAPELVRVEVPQFLQVLDDFNRSGLRGEVANERRAHEGTKLETGRAPANYPDAGA